MILTAVFLIWALLAATSVVGPAYPPDAVAGGTVVAVLRVSAGTVSKISIQHGDAPFVEPAQAALSRWRFSPGESGDNLVVINFRAPTLYAVGPPSKILENNKAFPELAYPRKVTDPGYPPNSLAEGSVVLRLELSETGAVSKVKTVQALGSLTSSCVTAAQSWQFAPAHNKRGSPSKANAYAVCVFRRPILPPHAAEQIPSFYTPQMPEGRGRSLEGLSHAAAGRQSEK